MSDFFAVQLDRAKADDGIEVRYRGNIMLRIASAESARYSEEIAKQIKKLSKPLADLDDDEAKQLEADIAARSLLLSWSNLEIGGELVEFSAEKAVELMIHPESDLLAFVQRVAANSGNFERGKIEEAAGN